LTAIRLPGQQRGRDPPCRAAAQYDDFLLLYAIHKYLATNAPTPHPAKGLQAFVGLRRPSRLRLCPCLQ
jgi:hypothetical protein